MHNQESNELYNLRLWQGIPSIGRDRFNNMYVAWYSGGKGEGFGNYVTVAYSKNEGLSWKKNIIIVSPIDSVRFFDPTFINDKYGNIYLGWSKSSKKKSNKKWTTTWCMKITAKNDSVITSPPIKLVEGIMLNKPINTADGKSMIFPVAYWFDKDSTKQKPFIYKGDYGANNIENFSVIGYIPLKNSLRSYDEHMVVEVSENNYLGMIRGKDGIYISWSKNNIDWTIPKKLQELGSIASSRFYVGKLMSGNLILIINNDNKRTNLKVFISIDHGKSWSIFKVIEDKLSISYPDLVQDVLTGKIYVVYDNDRNTRGRIYCASFYEKDILIPSKNINISIIDKIY